MSATKTVATGLSKKLVAFRAGLSPAETKALDGLLESLGSQAAKITPANLAKVPGGKDALATMRTQLGAVGSGDVAVTPTVTTVTITTTVASHPIIGCSAAARLDLLGRPGRTTVVRPGGGRPTPR